MKTVLKLSKLKYVALLCIMAALFIQCSKRTTMSLAAIDNGRHAVLIFVSFNHKCRIGDDDKALVRNRTRAFMEKLDYDADFERIIVLNVDSISKCLPSSIRIDSLVLKSSPPRH
jgi:hypothetical protein